MIFPAAVSYTNVLRFLIGRRLDLFLAVLLCIVVGLIGVDLWSGRQISDRQLILTWLPMYQLCLLVIAYYSFLQVMKREPVDVVFDMNAGKWPDRFFFMLIGTLHILLPALLLAQGVGSLSSLSPLALLLGVAS